MIRAAFAGSSGTGKTTLARYVSHELGLPLCPVGSRSVARDMGFDNPYDVDKSGRRPEFQHRLMTTKAEWERANPAFVTDRTTADNLAYLALHAVHAVDDAALDLAAEGLRRYTHVFYCPVASFCSPDGDPARVQAAAYHRVYDAVLVGLLARLGRDDVVVVQPPGLLARRALVRAALAPDPAAGLRAALRAYDALPEGADWDEAIRGIVQAARASARGPLL
jgi:predicted ATPase